MIEVIDLIAAADQPTQEPCPSGHDSRRIREAAGVSPTALAAAVGMAERTLLSFEREQDRNPRSAAVRVRLGRVLNYLAEADVKSATEVAL
jgi:DNA-binding transcriptional regulator YiaG